MREVVWGLLILGGLVALMLWLVRVTDDAAVITPDDMNVVCLDGVEYWYRQAGNKAMLAVKFNTDGTLSLCEGN